MNAYWKILSILLLIIGEGLAIYAEMIAAKNYSLDTKPLLKAFIFMFIIMTFAGGMLILGYMFGYAHFKNIWIVSAVSITSILILEPLLAYMIYKELPTIGATIGLVLGILGFVATLVL